MAFHNNSVPSLFDAYDSEFESYSSSFKYYYKYNIN